MPAVNEHFFGKLGLLETIEARPLFMGIFLCFYLFYGVFSLSVLIHSGNLSICVSNCSIRFIYQQCTYLNTIADSVPLFHPSFHLFIQTYKHAYNSSIVRIFIQTYISRLLFVCCSAIITTAYIYSGLLFLQRFWGGSKCTHVAHILTEPNSPLLITIDHRLHHHYQ